MSWRGTRLAIVLSFLTACGASAAQTSLADAGADRLHYDNQCITIDGKDLVLFSGAFHYFRCPKELWADRFRKLKEAGFNTVETYVAWNFNERTLPDSVDDFSKVDMTDLSDWLAMATDQFGFYVILRPGPYICAEWDGGGYPQWLITKKPADFHGKEWFRGDDATYLAWCKHWYTAVAKAAAPFQITHRPVGKTGIILWQIENEYNYSDQPIAVKVHQLDFLAHCSRDLGIDVPLTTCMTNNPAYRRDEYLRQNVVETRNTYPKYSVPTEQRDIGVLATYQPEKFKMISELQGGWFSQVGGELSEAQGFDAAHINHVTQYAWENGFTVTNYYMGFGGTNFGDWAAEDITTTYDYDAPVRECGGVTQRYLAVKALGNFITDHGPQLARAVPEEFDVKQKTDQDVRVSLRRAADGSRFLFVRTDQRYHPQSTGTVKLQTDAPDSVEISATYQIGPFGAKILYLPQGATSDTDGQWYPKPVEGPQRPTDLPATVRVTEAKMMVDPGPTQWTAADPTLGIESAGIFNRGFVFYRTTLPTSASGKLAISAHPHGHDWAEFELNGKPLAGGQRSGTFELPDDSAGGQLIGLYENGGRANGGADMEKPCGLLDLRIGQASEAGQALTGWRATLVDQANHDAQLAVDADDSKWAGADITQQTDGPLQPGQSAVYRTSVELHGDELAASRVLVLGRVDDEGEAYVNGKKVGQCDDWSTEQRFDVAGALHEGKNVIVVYVHNSDGPGGLTRGAWLESQMPGVDAKWEISDQTAGVAGEWWNLDFDDSAWKTVPIDRAATAGVDPLLTWYRVKFELPTPNEHQWVPWKAHLDIVGNGFLYLNGHPLGRWWQQGPQRDFFLPECWMNFGPGKTNVLTMSLRPTDGVAVRGVEIGPYANMAEVR